MYNMDYAVSELSTLVRDEQHTRWTVAQKRLAIRLGCDAMWPKWFDSDTVTVPFVSGTHVYTIPKGIEYVSEAYFRPADKPRMTVTRWRVHGGVLEIDATFPEYGGELLYLDVVYRPRRLLDLSYTGAVITGALATRSGASFMLDGVRPGDVLFEGTVPSFGAAQHRVADVINNETLLITDSTNYTGDISINPTTDIPITPVVYYAAYHLQMMEATKGNQKDVSQQLEWAQMYRSVAEIERERAARRLPPRRS